MRKILRQIVNAADCINSALCLHPVISRVVDFVFIMAGVITGFFIFRAFVT